MADLFIFTFRTGPDEQTSRLPTARGSRSASTAKCPVGQLHFRGRLQKLWEPQRGRSPPGGGGGAHLGHVFRGQVPGTLNVHTPHRLHHRLLRLPCHPPAPPRPLPHRPHLRPRRRRRRRPPCHRIPPPRRRRHQRRQQYRPPQLHPLRHLPRHQSRHPPSRATRPRRALRPR